MTTPTTKLYASMSNPLVGKLPMRISVVGMFSVLHHLPIVKLVHASNLTYILIKWKMEIKIFKMWLIHFPFYL